MLLNVSTSLIQYCDIYLSGLPGDFTTALSSVGGRMGYADVCLIISVYLLIPLNSKKKSIKLNKTPNINKHGRFNIKTWRV